MAGEAGELACLEINLAKHEEMSRRRWFGVVRGCSRRSGGPLVARRGWDRGAALPALVQSWGLEGGEQRLAVPT